MADCRKRTEELSELFGASRAGLQHKVADEAGGQTEERDGHS